MSAERANPSRDLFLADYQHLRRCGLNVSQIAQRLGQPLDTVMQRLRRLRAAGIDPEPQPAPDMPDLDVAVTVASICEAWVGELDSYELFTWLVGRMKFEPERMAQVVMVLAAWLAPGEDAAVRERRVTQLLVERSRVVKQTTEEQA